MRSFLLLGSDRNLCARVRRIVGSGWRVEEASDWPTVVRRLWSSDPPELLLCSGSLLSADAVKAVLQLHRKGYLVPAAVYLERPTPAVSYRAGELHRFHFESIFGPEELESGVHALLQRATHDLGDMLIRMLAVPPGAAKRLLVLLDRERELRVATPDRLAYELHCSRSALYRALRGGGLPPPGSIQALYRLWPGVARILAGGRGADAAFEAQCPHYHSFRKAVLTHFGLTIGQLRTADDLDTVLRRWVDYHQAHDPQASPRRPLGPFTHHEQHQPHTGGHLRISSPSPTVFDGDAPQSGASRRPNMSIGTSPKPIR